MKILIDNYDNVVRNEVICNAKKKNRCLISVVCRKSDETPLIILDRVKVGSGDDFLIFTIFKKHFNEVIDKYVNDKPEFFNKFILALRIEEYNEDSLRPINPLGKNVSLIKYVDGEMSDEDIKRHKC
jgi:hypothetical protein